MQFHYLPTVTREEFPTQGRIGTLIEDGSLFIPQLRGPAKLDPEHDRIMLCGSMAMIREFEHSLEAQGFEEGSNNKPGDFVIERAFVD